MLCLMIAANQVHQVVAVENVTVTGAVVTNLPHNQNETAVLRLSNVWEETCKYALQKLSAGSCDKYPGCRVTDFFVYDINRSQCCIWTLTLCRGYVVVTCEIKHRNYFEIICVFYFICNHVWYYFNIISAAKIILKLFPVSYTHLTLPTNREV